MVWFIVILGSAISALLCFLDIYFIEKKFRVIDICPTLFLILTSWLGVLVSFMVILFDVSNKYDKVIWTRKEN